MQIKILSRFRYICPMFLWIRILFSEQESEISNLSRGIEIERMSSVTGLTSFFFFFFFQTMTDFSAEPPQRPRIPWPIHVILQRNTRGNRDTDRSIRNWLWTVTCHVTGLPRILSEYQYFPLRLVRKDHIIICFSRMRSFFSFLLFHDKPNNFPRSHN